MSPTIGSLNAILVVACLLLLSVLYVGGYALLVTNENYAIVNAEGILMRNPIRIAKYRRGGEAADWFFQPAHQMDRWLRPEHWESGWDWE